MSEKVPEVAHEREHPSNLALYIGIVGVFLGVLIAILAVVYPQAGQAIWLGLALLAASVIPLLIGMGLRRH